MIVDWKFRWAFFKQGFKAPVVPRGQPVLLLETVLLKEKGGQ
jgi:hypothetical protein